MALADQTIQRVEEFGYDRDDRQYYLLDDNRLYRRTEPPLPAAPKAKAKANTKKAQAAKRRASERRRIEDSEEPDIEEEETSTPVPEETNGEVQGTPAGADVDTFGGYKWECVAITLPDYQDLVESLKKTKDPNEKALRQRLIAEVIPIIEAAEERQRRKIERRERELMAMEKMATAKRSSRIAGRVEREKKEVEEAEAERKRVADLAAARRDQERQDQMDKDRQSRMMTREQRIKDREFKRILAEEEIARAAEEQKRIEEGGARGSERQLKDRIAKNKKELEELEEEDEWTFDCSGCGVYGKNLDDGSHSVACEKCNVWQHSKCLKISKAEAEKDDFHFVCRDCKRKEEEAKRPKTMIKFKMTSSSPAPPSPARVASSPQKPQPFSMEVPRYTQYRPPSQGSMVNGYPPQPYPMQAYPTQPAPGYVQRQPNGYPSYPYQHQGYGMYQPQQVAPPQQHPSSSSPPIGPLQPQHSSQAMHQPRPGSSGQSWARPPAQTQPQFQHYNPAWYSQSYQHSSPQVNPSQRPPSSHGPVRPSSSHSHANGQTPSTNRLPSPVVNRPIITPTQGNYDVSRVAGIPQKSSPSPQILPNGTPTPHINQLQPHNSSSSSSTPQQQLSGISPTKPTPPSISPQPLPAPSNIPMKLSMSPPLPQQHNYQRSDVRSVSGTPIVPPVEKLQPSPQLANQAPVPTPTKNSPPMQQNEGFVNGGPIDRPDAATSAAPTPPSTLATATTRPAESGINEERTH